MADTTTTFTPYVPVFKRPGFKSPSAQSSGGGGLGAFSSIALPLAMLGSRYLYRNWNVPGTVANDIAGWFGGGGAAGNAFNVAGADAFMPGALAAGEGGFAAIPGSASFVGPMLPGAAESVTGAVAPGLGNSFGLFGTGMGQYALPGIGAALGALGTYKAMQSGNKRSGGLGGAMSGAAMGASIGSMIPGVGTTIGALAGALLGGGLGLTAHETTADRTKRRYAELAGLSPDTGFQSALQKGRDWSLSGEDTWDIGDPLDQAPIEGMKNAYGVLKAFGPDWMKYSGDQQSNILKQMVAENLVNSKQGEYLVDNIARAKEIAAGLGAPSGATGGSALDASGNRTRDWQPGDRVYGRYYGGR